MARARTAVEHHHEGAGAEATRKERNVVDGEHAENLTTGRKTGAAVAAPGQSLAVLRLLEVEPAGQHERAPGAKLDPGLGVGRHRGMGELELRAATQIESHFRC